MSALQLKNAIFQVKKIARFESFFRIKGKGIFFMWLPGLDILEKPFARTKISNSLSVLFFHYHFGSCRFGNIQQLKNEGIGKLLDLYIGNVLPYDRGRGPDRNIGPDDSFYLFIHNIPDFPLN